MGPEDIQEKQSTRSSRKRKSLMHRILGERRYRYFKSRRQGFAGVVAVASVALIVLVMTAIIMREM